MPVGVQAIQIAVKVPVMPPVQASVLAKSKHAQQKLPDEEGSADGSAVGVQCLHRTAPLSAKTRSDTE